MERRLAAIVAADVVNYSTLISQNDFGTISALAQLHQDVFHPVVTQYNGRMVRFMGDGSLIAFDSALDAVKFAFDVQRIMAARKSSTAGDLQIHFRMGANLGDIILEKQDVHGEGINVAVRLEELAPPGGICLSDGIYRQTKNALREELLPIGERHLKNIADPVFIWRWQPPGTEDGVLAADAAYPRLKPAHGRQVLDPKVTSLIVDLHVRSARLALCEAFDDLLAMAEDGCRLSLRQIQQNFAEKLDEARELLLPILIELGEPRSERLQRRWTVARPMSSLVADALDGGDIVLAPDILQRIQCILWSAETETMKRAAFLRLAREFLHESRGPRIKELIRYAYVEA